MSSLSWTWWNHYYNLLWVSFLKGAHRCSCLPRDCITQCKYIKNRGRDGHLKTWHHPCVEWMSLQCALQEQPTRENSVILNWNTTSLLFSKQQRLLPRISVSLSTQLTQYHDPEVKTRVDFYHMSFQIFRYNDWIVPSLTHTVVSKWGSCTINSAEVNWLFNPYPILVHGKQSSYLLCPNGGLTWHEGWILSSK